MSTTTASSERDAARRLRASIRGTVLVDGDAMYGEARQLWNGAVDKRPAAIARCADELDVATAVAVAREHDLPLSVRGGGHDWAGRAFSDGGAGYRSHIDARCHGRIRTPESRPRRAARPSGTWWGLPERSGLLLSPVR